MFNKYYIELSGVDFQQKWSFENLEYRNEIYNKVEKKFKKDLANQIPFIEVSKGDEEQIVPLISNNLKLNPEIKYEIVNYINSLED